MLESPTIAGFTRVHRGHGSFSGAELPDLTASRIAHDINNVLQIISGNLALVAKEVGNDGAAARHIARALAGVDLGTKLARGVLEQRPSGRNADLDIRRFADRLPDLLESGIGADVTLEVEAWASGCIGVDAAELENVLLNLAINARDAMEGSGSLKVSIHRPKLQRDRIAISMTDTGCGMPASVAARVFDPYFTTKGRKGSGLGLCSVKHFAEASGGCVSLASEEGSGTTVTIELPFFPYCESKAAA